LLHARDARDARFVLKEDPPVIFEFVGIQRRELRLNPVSALVSVLMHQLVNCFAKAQPQLSQPLSER